MKALEIVIVASTVLREDSLELTERILVNVNGTIHSVISEKNHTISDWEIYLPAALTRIPRIKTAIMMKMFDWVPNTQDLES